MAVPNYQVFMVPILSVARDGIVHTTADFEAGAADLLKLSVDDRAEMLSSGSMTVLRDRVGWAFYHMYRAGLLDRPARGRYVITPRGQQALQDSPQGIDQKYLKQFASYREYLTKSKEAVPSSTEAPTNEPATQTPQGAIEAAYKVLQQQLAAELLEQVMAKSPAFFEDLVLKLLVKMGYGGSEQDARVTGRSGDGGIDGLINEVRLGLDRIYVQAKRWQNKVGTPEMRDFVGSLAGGGAHKGVFITTSGFQPGVSEYLRGVQHRVVLIDGPRLAELCIQFGVGVLVEGAYHIKRIDLSFFEAE